MTPTAVQIQAAIESLPTDQSSFTYQEWASEHRHTLCYALRALALLRLEVPDPAVFKNKLPDVEGQELAVFRWRSEILRRARES